MFRGPKDAALAFSARTFLNSRLKGIGEVTHLAVDTGAHSLTLTIALAGEATPVDIHIRQYAIERLGEQATLEIIAADTSRPWLNAVLTQFVIGHRFQLPDKAATVVGLLA